MNKIFHARISWYHYFCLIMLTGAGIWELWEKNAFMGLIWMLFIIVIIEKIIHTTYTVTTDGKLIVHNGRFSKKVKIEIKNINSIKRCHTMNFRNFHFAEYVLVQYNNEKYLSLEPIKEQELIDLINKIKTDGQGI